MTSKSARLDVGCGPEKLAGAVGLDHRALPGVDGSLLPESRYELVRRHLSFGSAIKTFPQRIWAAVFGFSSNERFCAWR